MDPAEGAPTNTQDTITLANGLTINENVVQNLLNRKPSNFLKQQLPRLNADKNELGKFIYNSYTNCKNGWCNLCLFLLL